MAELLCKLEINNLRDGDCFLIHNYPFEQGFNPLGWCTQLATRCYYHHASVYFDGYIYESTADGVEKSYPIEQYLERIGKQIEVFVFRKEIYVTRGQIESNLGIPYDYVGTLFWQPIRQVTNEWYGGIREDKLNCSGFVAKIIGRENYWEYDPQDLYREALEEKTVFYVSNPKQADKINKILNCL